MARIIFPVLTLIIALITSGANAAYVQSIRCPDGSGGTRGFEDVWPTSTWARLLRPNDSSSPGQGGARLELDVRADYMGKATCEELLGDGPSEMTIALDALDLAGTYVVRPSNWTCLPYRDMPASQQKYLADRGSQIRLIALLDLGVLGLLPTFAAKVSFSASNKTGAAEGALACVYSEITPQLRQDVSSAVRYGSIAIFLLVFVSGSVCTLFTPAVSVGGGPSDPVIGSSQGVAVQRTILPGVADCLLHLQFIFFLGALNLRYPGFYQPVTSLFHWSALFSPSGPFGQDRRYDMVRDGIYEINGTLTGSYGLELMSQITGGPVTMHVWWNMVVIATIITAVAAMFLLACKAVSRHIPCPSFSLRVERGLGGQGPVSGVVARAVLSYFLTPIVALSAYQLDNVFLPAYHLALASLLILAVMVAVTWMWRISPSNQLGVLLLDSSKRYRLARMDGSDSDSDSGPPGRNRDLFAAIFFALAFARGIAVGGFQFSPLTQVVGLAAIELALLVSTAVLRPLNRRVLSVFTWSGVARLVVVALTAVFLPELDASISLKGRVGIAILVIHATVLVLGCAVPAAIRIASLVHLGCARSSAEEPQIYGLSQLRRRNNAVNDLASVSRPYPRSESTHSFTRTSSSRLGHSSRSPSDGSSVSFYLDGGSSPETLYLRAVPQHHYFRAPLPSASASLHRHYAASSANVSPPSSTSPLVSKSEPSSSEKKEDPRPPANAPSFSTSPLEKHRQSSTAARNGTGVKTAEPSLGPQWSDYSFREADLYYGQTRPQRVENPVSAASAAPQNQPSTARHVMSSMWDRLTGRNSRLAEREPPRKGFEVRRPARPAGV